MITPLVRTPPVKLSPISFFYFFSTLSSSTHHLIFFNLLLAREDPPPSAPMRARGGTVKACGGGLASLPPPRAAGRRRLGGAHARAQVEALARPSRARPSGHGPGEVLRPQIGPDENAAVAGVGRGGGISGTGTIGKLTPFVVPARVPLNPTGAAPSARFRRTSPTRISREYSLLSQPNPS